MRTALAVFDLDGTLIDSRRDLADTANLMLAGYGAPPIADADIVRMVGCGAATLVERVLAAAGVQAPLADALPRFLAVYEQRLTNHTRPYDGIVDLLDVLAGRRIPMALLTNKPLAPSVAILEAFGIRKYFRSLVGGDGPWPRKPSPEGLLHLMREASSSPADTMLIGDSSVDLETARNAGVRVCLARYGFGFAEIADDRLTVEDVVVDAPADIAGAVNAG